MDGRGQHGSCERRCRRPSPSPATASETSWWCWSSAAARPEARQAWRARSRGAVREAIAVDSEVVLVPPPGLPQTSSGKLQPLARQGQLSRPASTARRPSPPRPDEPCAELVARHRRHRLPRTASRSRPGAPRLEGPAAGAPLVSRCRRWPGVEAEMVAGRLSDDATRLRRLVEGADVVVHAAGLIKARRPCRLHRGQRDGTARVSRPRTPTAAVRCCCLAGGARAAAVGLCAPASARPRKPLAGRLGPWLAVRPPAVYGPGDRETLRLFPKAWRAALRPVPRRRPDARLALIHVDDPPGRWRWPSSRPPPASVYDSMTAGPGAMAMRDMRPPPVRAWAGRLGRLPIPRRSLAAVAVAERRCGHALAVRRRSSPGKVREMLHTRLGGATTGAGRSDRFRRAFRPRGRASPTPSLVSRQGWL